MSTKCTFTHVEQHAELLEPCPLCGHEAEIWQHDDDHGTFRFACCGRCAADEDLLAGAECPLTLPPRHFYKARNKDAATAWNAFASACCISRQQFCLESIAKAAGEQQ